MIAQPNDFNPERIVLASTTAVMPRMNVGDHYTSPVIGTATYAFDNFFLEAEQVPTVVHDGVTPEVTARPDARPACGGDVQRREPRTVRSGVEVQPAREHLRHEPARAGHRRGRRSAGQQRRDRRRHRRRRPDAREADRRDLRRRAARRTSTARSTRSTTRTAASPAATSASSSCSAPIVACRSSTRPAEPRRRPTPSRRAATCSTQPGRDRPRQLGMDVEPQAARRRVHVARPEGVRDRQPLRREARRRSARGPRATAGVLVRGSAEAAGDRGARLRRRASSPSTRRRTSSSSAI